MDYRPATKRDAEAIAALHAESWRTNYRGAFSETFLDGEVFEDRWAVWSERLSEIGRSHDTVVSEDAGVIIGFAHTVLDHDPVWGAFLDNLHVARQAKRRGVGTQLMARSATAILARGRHRSLYLLVLETNAAAQAFYEARGGTCVGSEVSEPPGGGSIVGLRYVWKDSSVLLPHPRSTRSARYV
ncbi:MAG: GNAT family N-acetyltransferase [Carbonactinosporaceae bacterium]